MLIVCNCEQTTAAAGKSVETQRLQKHCQSSCWCLLVICIQARFIVYTKYSQVVHLFGAFWAADLSCACGAAWSV